jgi:FixJ family two-component response regulator
LAKSESILICVLDNDLLALTTTSRLLSSQGWRVEKFIDPDGFVRYARAHHPPIAVIDFWVREMNRLEVAARLQEISCSTHPIISLKLHCSPKAQHRMMARDELVGLIKRRCGRDFGALLPDESQVQSR